MTGRLSNELMAQAVAALERGHQLFVGPIAEGAVGDVPGQIGAHATNISSIAGAGLPSTASARSAAMVPSLHGLADGDSELASIINDARENRDHAARSTKVILDAARADPIPAADTPMGQREALRRMILRLRAQRGHVLRARGSSAVLAARLRRLAYLRALAGGHGGLDAGSASGNGEGAATAAIRQALDVNKIFDPKARARWEAGMKCVARRESNFVSNAVNHADSNAAAGNPSAGMFQFTRSTLNAYHQPGTSYSQHDNTAEACAFINYARRRYGVALDGSNLAARIQQADPTRPPKGY